MIFFCNRNRQDTAGKLAIEVLSWKHLSHRSAVLLRSCQFTISALLRMHPFDTSCLSLLNLHLLIYRALIYRGYFWFRVKKGRREVIEVNIRWLGKGIIASFAVFLNCISPLPICFLFPFISSSGETRHSSLPGGTVFFRYYFHQETSSDSSSF